MALPSFEVRVYEEFLSTASGFVVHCIFLTAGLCVYHVTNSVLGRAYGRKFEGWKFARSALIN